VLSHIDCSQPASRTWQRRFDDEGKKVAMFSMTMNDMMGIVPMIVKVLKLQVEDSAEGRVSNSFINKLYDIVFFLFRDQLSFIGFQLLNVTTLCYPVTKLQNFLSLF
jgi:hypothetical protein